jgi:pimeloyl-ACP methyl ester carboxylesterase
VSAPSRLVDTPDGRRLALWEGGDPDGLLVLMHHGSPGAGLLYEPHVRDAAERGLRLVGYNRPGYGDSTRQQGRAVAAAAADAATVADALEAERFATWGFSGGGPHALACAAQLPERIVAAASLAGVAPYGAEGLDYTAGMGEDNIEEFGLALDDPDALRPRHEADAATVLAGDAAALAGMFETLVSPVDQAMFHGRLAAFLHAGMAAGLGAGVDGWLDDDVAFVSPWGFDVGAIEVPVLVWHGDHDRFVPPAHGDWLAEHIPGTEASLRADDGHLTIAERRLPDVHAWLRERF